MRLEELTGDLASAVASAQPTAGGDVAIGGLAYDSRAVRPEDLFFCVSGFQSDGHEFAGQIVRVRCRNVGRWAGVLSHADKPAGEVVLSVCVETAIPSVWIATNASAASWNVCDAVADRWRDDRAQPYS